MTNDDTTKPDGTPTTPTTSSSKTHNNNNNNNNSHNNAKHREVGHYVVTAHRAGSVLLSQKCSFLSPDSTDLVIAKACRLEIRQFKSSLKQSPQSQQPPPSSSSSSSPHATRAGSPMDEDHENDDNDDASRMKLDEDDEDEDDEEDRDVKMQQEVEKEDLDEEEEGWMERFPVVLDLPIRGRICTLLSFRPKHAKTDFLFFSTERHKYAVLSYDTTTSSILTHDVGNVNDVTIGRDPEHGPIAAVCPHSSCLVVHFYDGFLRVVPIVPYMEEPLSGGGGGGKLGAVGSGKKGKSTAGGGKVGLSLMQQDEEEHGHGHGSGAGTTTAATMSHRNARGSNVLGEAYLARIDQQTLLTMAFLYNSYQPESDAAGVAVAASAAAAAASASTLTSQSAPPAMPRLAILHQDSRGAQHVITHTVDIANRDVLQHSHAQARASVSASGTGQRGRPPSTATAAAAAASSTSNIPTTAAVGPKKNRVDGGSGMMIPVPFLPPTSSNTNTAHGGGGGILLVGQHQITYLNSTGHGMKVLPMEHTVMMAYCQVPLSPNASGVYESVRFLLGDDRGYLYVLALVLESSSSSSSSGASGNGSVNAKAKSASAATAASSHPTTTTTPTSNATLMVVTSLHMENLGLTSIPSTLHYLDSSILFLGSQFGDSQLLQLRTQRHPETRSYLEVCQEYTNLGPIVDFDLVDLDGKGQCQVVTCSGTAADGSVRVVRNGIGIHEQADVEIPGIKGMWNLRASFHDVYDKYLVQSFIHETRILAITEDEMEEVHLPGIAAHAATLHAGNVCAGDGIVQVTEREVILVSCKTKQAVDVWTPLNGERITVAGGNAFGQVVVALRGGVLVSLEVVSSSSSSSSSSNVDGEGYGFVVRGTTRLDEEVSCLNLDPLKEQADTRASSLVSESAMMDTSSDTQQRLAKKRKDERGSVGAGGMDIDAPHSRNHPQQQPDKPSSSDVEDQTQSLPTTAIRSNFVAVGLWNDFTVRILRLDKQDETSSNPFSELLRIELGGETQARSLLMTTLEGQQGMLLVGLGDGQLISYFLRQPEDRMGSSGEGTPTGGSSSSSLGKLSVMSRKKVSLGTQSISLCAFRNASNGNTCVFASGDRPTVVYMSSGKVLYSNINLSTNMASSGGGGGAGGSGGGEEVVNWVCPFHCELFPDCLCLASEENLRIGTIDDIQKLHVQTWRLGETPRRIAHHRQGRMFVVGVITGAEDGGIGADVNLGNVVRFLDDTTFEEIHRVDLDPFEMIQSLISCPLENTAAQKMASSSVSASSAGGGSRSRATSASSISEKYYVVVGTSYAYPDEDEPNRGRILVFETSHPNSAAGGTGGEEEDAAAAAEGGSMLSRTVRQLTEYTTRGAVYSLCPFRQGSLLASVNSKTNMYLWSDVDGVAELKDTTASHHGHILSLYIKSACGLPSGAGNGSVGGGCQERNQNLAIVGDLMRSISVLQYHEGNLVEVARDYNANWTTAIEMLSEEVYLGAENWNNLFALRRNVDSTLEEVRCRLDTQGEYHLGEMVNKFARGSLVMPSSTSSGDAADGSGGNASVGRVVVGSQTLYATVDGSIGVVMGLDRGNFAFFRSLERSMASEIPAVGGFSHEEFRAFVAERRVHISRGFIDGDLVEAFLDLSRGQMEMVVERMNDDGGWDLPDDSAVVIGGGGGGGSGGGANSGGSAGGDAIRKKGGTLSVDDVLTRVEEMSRLH